MTLIETGKMGFKGHVVMPKAVRELLGIGQGSIVAWVITDDNRVEVRTITEAAIVKARKASIQKWLASHPRTQSIEDEFLKETGIHWSNHEVKARPIRNKLVKERFSNIAAQKRKNKSA
jgi:AbrB family looped-hinge helix DNA binding protein